MIKDNIKQASSKEDNSDLILKAKEFLKKDDTMKKIVKEYNCDVSIIDHIPTCFKQLDVSAKTAHGIVYINSKLLKDGDFTKDYGYLIHEYTHWFQQCFGKQATQGADDGSYLDNPYEQEGFQNQIEFIDDHFGEEEAEDYVDNLLDYHDVPKKEENEKKEVLMSKV